METILKSGIWKILRLFYNQRNARLHLRDIARKAGLNENSASRFLEKMEKGGILSSEKDGNLKKYSLIKGDNVFVLLSVLDVERLSKLPSIRRNAIRYFLNALPEQPVFVLLFGSTAKGIYTRDSDIDLLLVVNRRIKTEEAEKQAEAQTAIKISPVQITYSNFARELRLKEDYVIQSALNTGYPLTNHIMYYEAVYNEAL
ncbi:MAG: nucleotidyltransferase domain-containing protein [Nanoarchaeota archaeon]|nr:nucleotidyltransferase domain-containing protein [Nanoarchaeota archaeon]